jgi:hypothetical protein
MPLAALSSINSKVEISILETLIRWHLFLLFSGWLFDFSHAFFFKFEIVVHRAGGRAI